MSHSDGFTIVVPTRNDAGACAQMLVNLSTDSRCLQLPLRVVFLANDTDPAITDRFAEVIKDQRFGSLRPRMLRARKGHPTADENVRFTLGENLTAVDDHFLIVGNSDLVDLDALANAVAYLHRHQLDLLLVGIVNREVHQAQPVRQFYTTPRHLNPKNRLGERECHGKDIFADALADYGPVDYLAYIGCQIYTKKFFRELCQVEAEFPDPLYSVPLATLEMVTRKPRCVGFFPDVVVIRIDELEETANSPGRYKTAQGLSSHTLLSVLTNSLYLSPPAFGTLLNAQMVSQPRGQSQYHFSNLLFMLVFQMSLHVMHSARDTTLRYSPGELQDIVKFGKRLAGVDIGLPEKQCAMISQWLQHFDQIGNYSDPARIDTLLAGSSPVLALLDKRPGMERWTAQLA